MCGFNVHGKDLEEAPRAKTATAGIFWLSLHVFALKCTRLVAGWRSKTEFSRRLRGIVGGDFLKTRFREDDSWYVLWTYRHSKNIFCRTCLVIKYYVWPRSRQIIFSEKSSAWSGKYFRQGSKSFCCLTKSSSSDYFLARPPIKLGLPPRKWPKPHMGDPPENGQNTPFLGPPLLIIGWLTFPSGGEIPTKCALEGVKNDSPPPERGAIWTGFFDFPPLQWGKNAIFGHFWPFFGVPPIFGHFRPFLAFLAIFWVFWPIFGVLDSGGIIKMEEDE